MLSPERQPQALKADEADKLFSHLSGLRLLLAVSGGPDSVAMMGICAAWSRRKGEALPLVAVVDHGLRPESAVEAGQVVTLACGLGLSVAVLRWDGDKPASAVQAAARAARYALLAGHALDIGADALLTAHTLDDQAETVLIRLAAGSGVAGLGAMTARTVTHGIAHHRPLLEVPKARLIATCEALGLTFCDDPGNRSDRYARGRLRAARQLLEREGLTTERLATLARRARAADEVVQAVARDVLKHGMTGDALDVQALASRPDAVIVAALGQWLAPAAETHLRLERLETCAKAILAAVRSGRPITRTLAGQVLTLTRDGRLTRRAEERRRGIVNPVRLRRLGKGLGQP